MFDPICNYQVPYSQRPSSLFYVHHAGSRARPSHHGGFDAASWWPRSQGAEYLLQHISGHLNWACRFPSRFISTFRNFDHALNWARQRRGPVTIYKIDTGLVDPNMVLIFDPSRLLPSCSHGEYLFLNTIPGHAIVRGYDVSGPTMCK